MSSRCASCRAISLLIPPFAPVMSTVLPAVETISLFSFAGGAERQVVVGDGQSTVIATMSPARAIPAATSTAVE